MYGTHLQNNVQGWTQHVALLPAGTPFKAVDGVQWLHEAKQHNSGIKTILRHWYDGKQHYDNAPYTVLLERAAAFFRTFIDGTFAQYAGSVDFVETWNETLANSQSPQERQARIGQERAFCEVWERDYKRLYPHIRLILANTAVGNDIPWQIASLAVKFGHVLGYHPYVGVFNRQVSPADDLWLSGRWRSMDATFRAVRNADHPNGIYVTWIGTEGGVCLDFSGTGQLDPGSGWKHTMTCGGSLASYKALMRPHLDAIAAWNRTNNNRFMGGVFFTMITPGGGQWDSFNLSGQEMSSMAEFIRSYTPGNPPPPPPPPPTTPPVYTVQTRVHLLRPQQLTTEQWTKIVGLMTGGISPAQIGRSGEANIVIGYEGWSHVDAYLAIKQSIEAGKTDSRLVILDGDQIGTGIDPQWIQTNWPVISPYTYFIET